VELQTTSGRQEHQKRRPVSICREVVEAFDRENNRAATGRLIIEQPQLTAERLDSETQASWS
jgi:hypothetical protein